MLAAGSVVVGLVIEFGGLAWSDTLWVLQVAGRLLDGDRLYHDIIEINPPLIFWLAVPVVQLAHWLHADPLAVWRCVVALGLAASVGVTARLLRSWAALPWIAFALFVVPGRSVYGEREHLVVAALLPWLAVAGRRLAGSRTRGMGLAGIPAAMAFALKPHYLLLWLAILWWERRRLGWHAIGLPEHGVTAGLLACYGLAVLFPTPDYLAVLSTWAPAYAAYHRAGLLTLLSYPVVPVACLALALAVRERTPEAALPAALVAAGLAAVLLQAKGFWYHYYPALAGSVLLLASIRHARARWSLGALTVGVLVLRLPEAVGRPNGDELVDRERMAILATGGEAETMAVLDTSGSMLPFRYAAHTAVTWRPRWPYLWPRAARDSLVGVELARFATNPPDLVLVRVTLPDGALPAYREGAKVGPFRVFRRTSLTLTETP